MIGRVLHIGVGLLAVCSAAQAAKVEVSVSSNEISLGEGLIVTVTVINANQHEPPYWPKMDDFTIIGQSGVQHQRLMQFGVTTSKHIYRYQLTANRLGQLTIPSIIVSADGTNQQTEPVQIQVSKSVELLFVEVVPDKTDVYVEEPLELTLKIWLRRFRQGRIELTENDLFQRIGSSSQLGIFTQVAQTAKAVVFRSLRVDSDGVEQGYYVYQWRQCVWPERAGPLELEPITIMVDYPQELKQDYFGDLVPTRSRALIGTASLPRITVKPIPTAGRPDIYETSGAVGTFRMKVTAAPTEVRVGDPITLNIKISALTGRLDYVSAPKLDRVPGFVENFKVYEEALPGKIEEDGKLFTQSIRAKSAGVKEIPPIPFAFFDPKTEQFRTIYSEVIPLKVEAAGQVNAGDVLAVAQNQKTRLLTEAAGGLFANYSDPSELLAVQSQEISWVWGAAAGILPVGYFCTLLTTRQRRRLREDVGLARRRSAGRRARKLLGRIRGVSDPAEEAALAATAVLTFIADRLNLPAAGMTRPDAVDHLRRSGADEQTIRRTDAFLMACEAARFAGRRDSTDGSPIGPAWQCVRDLEKIRLGNA
jgi:hypothetical protein